MRTTFPILSRIGLAARRRPLVATVVALTLSAVGTAVFKWDWIVTCSDGLDRTRSQSFLQQGMRAWQQGDGVTARLCFETALEIDPSHVDAALTLGRLQLQQGNRAQGRAVFLETAKRFSDSTSSRIALVYHDSLIGCGWWEELATLGIEQLAGLGRPEPLWLNAAIEGTRLRNWTRPEIAAVLANKPLDRVSRSLVMAQGALNDGDGAVARELLSTAQGMHRLETAWILARLWRRLGDTAESRLALARTDIPVGPEMSLLIDYWIMQDEPDLQRRQFARIVTRAFTPPSAPTLIPSLVNLTLEQGRGGSSSTLLQELGRRRANVAVQHLSALWLLALREQDESAAAAWLTSLREAIDRPPVLKAAQEWNEKTLLLVAGSLPLSRDTVYALIGALEPIRRSVEPNR